MGFMLLAWFLLVQQVIRHILRCMFFGACQSARVAGPVVM
jgi:hypothetical protein